MIEVENKLPKRLKEVREENNLYQRQLADMLGYTQVCIAMWEAGTRNPNPVDIIRLCKCLKVSADYLLGIED